MRSFQEIYDLACLHKGGRDSVESLLPKAESAKTLSECSDNYFLSNMCRRIFRAGLKHSLVDSKWPNFERVFHNFDPYFCAMLSEDDIDNHMKDTRIIRHRGKLTSIQKNAQFILETSKETGSFGAYLAQWQVEQTVHLWWELKKKGKQLGGNSGPTFLRMVNKDTFLLTRDVVAVLMNESVIEREPTSKKDILKAQDAFTTWHHESGRALCEISRIVSFTATS